LHCFAVCSDPKVGQKSDSEDISTHDLAFPAHTNAQQLARQFDGMKRGAKLGMSIVFSTYQSVAVVAQAQKHGLPEFDLIICDEAHRTTGVEGDDKDASAFVKVHDARFIKGKKRLYMTGTPRIYDDASKGRAKEEYIEIYSMDDEAIYGPEFHRLDFSEAVRRDLLTDYKVMVLAVDEKHVSTAFQRQLADKNNELKLEDAVKIVGCWNGLSKRMVAVEGDIVATLDPAPMRRGVAFSRSIKDSKSFTDLFANIITKYKTAAQSTENSDGGDDFLKCEVAHVDGTMNALVRSAKLRWLKEDTTSQGNTCRVLSNARCLSEGVDVPALDAVMFLNPRNSVVDVVQSVGRVMRKAPGKQFGYIILPVGIPADMAPEKALADNQKYKVVWQVLQALRAHDDRFNAIVNQIDLNNKRPDQIQVIGVGGNDPSDGATASTLKPVQLNVSFPELENWKDAIFAKIVIKCGSRKYWETWANDVANIAQRHITRIKALLDASDHKYRKRFGQFLGGLRSTLNPSTTEDDAIEMLSQHLITKPVFDSLFEGYNFTKQNPVSITMQSMLDLLEGESLEKDAGSLDKFYASVRERASGIDNAEGKQKIIVELYDKFFKTAFPRMADRLGIVYTPVEIVDFILHSANDALRKEFGVGLTDKNVHILDPFTGTGTFMVRLLQSSDIVTDKDLLRKYRDELHANEIILLAYYIAAINIEEAYHGRLGGDYRPFEGIVLTDTFQMTENTGTLAEKMFPDNNKRASRQNKRAIRVIVANPPYSAQQESENDANKNLKYPQLDEKIRRTYAAQSAAGLKKNLYDSYVRSIRWASDRIKDNGIVCYVSNGSFIDSNSMDGLRACMLSEFTSIYCFHLRGNARTSGEPRRMEGGSVFGSGTRTPIAITLLVKNPNRTADAMVHYYDIGDYLTREQKLQIISDLSTTESIQWETIVPNKNHDWINQRDPSFERFMPLGDKDGSTRSQVFSLYSLGVLSARDAWAYNFSKRNLAANMGRMIAFYNSQVRVYEALCGKTNKAERPSVDESVDNDAKKISWTHNLKSDLQKGVVHKLEDTFIATVMYRPYCKQWMYFHRRFNERVYQVPKLFPKEGTDNRVIAAMGIGVTKPFSALMSATIPDYEMISKGQCFPLYSYHHVGNDDGETGSESLFKTPEGATEWVKKDSITDATLNDFRKTHGSKVTKLDLFYYVYGILHSPEYKRRFASDLKKMLPRIPMAGDFWAFSKAGRKLADIHLSYEKAKPYQVKQHCDVLALDPETLYQVQKMYFGKRDKKPDKTTIIYNSHITLTGIPPEAYEYVVNGKSAIEWIMERYQITKDKDSGIVNDPNDWAMEHGDPEYILRLLKSIITVSLETMKVVKALPSLDER